MNALVRAIDPPAPADVRAAGDDLHYRDFLTVALVVPEAKGFPDNWIYIHAPEVAVGRIQNFGSWSPFMVKEGRTCLGLEYFVFEGDELWSSSDDELIERGQHELEALGLVQAADVEAGYVVRVPKAYPYYDFAYRANVETITAYLDEAAPNVHPVGRNGMHKYNNQDHSMYTAMLTVENILGADHDIWAVNVEEEYHEVQSGSAAGEAGDRSGRAGAASPGPRRVVARGAGVLEPVDRSTSPDGDPHPTPPSGRHRFDRAPADQPTPPAGAVRRGRARLPGRVGGALVARLVDPPDGHRHLRLRRPGAVLVVPRVAGLRHRPRPQPLLLDRPVPPGRHQPAVQHQRAGHRRPAGPGHLAVRPGRHPQRGVDARPRPLRPQRVLAPPALDPLGPRRLRRRPVLRRSRRSSSAASSSPT